MQRVIVIGSGAGGAMAAKMLASRFDVTVLEEGKVFKPFSLPLEQLAKFRKTGVYFDERLIQLLLPNMRIDRAKEMIMVYGRGLGGTTTLATGNAVRADEGLKKIGIHLDEEFDELYVNVTATIGSSNNTAEGITRDRTGLIQNQVLDKSTITDNTNQTLIVTAAFNNKIANNVTLTIKLTSKNLWRGVTLTVAFHIDISRKACFTILMYGSINTPPF